MVAATTILGFAMLQGAAIVFGNPSFSGINTGLQGWQRTKCEVTDQFVSYYSKAPQGVYSG